MEKRTTYSTAFVLRASKSSKKEALIFYCRITVDMQQAEFSIKKKIRKAIWNNGQPKTNSEDGRSIAMYLKQVESEVFRHQ